MHATPVQLLLAVLCNCSVQMSTTIDANADGIGFAEYIFIYYYILAYCVERGDYFAI